MLSNKQIQAHFKEMESKLIKDKRNVGLTTEWTKEFPDKPGIYVAFENNKFVYVGETGKIRGRLKDLLDSRHHNLRRNIGKENFSSVHGYKKADSKNKFPENIEKKVDAWLKEKIKISVLPINFGRKELEEYLVKKYSLRYNRRGQRRV